MWPVKCNLGDLPLDIVFYRKTEQEKMCIRESKVLECQVLIREIALERMLERLKCKVLECRV